MREACMRPLDSEAEWGGDVAEAEWCARLCLLGGTMDVGESGLDGTLVAVALTAVVAAVALAVAAAAGVAAACACDGTHSLHLSRYSFHPSEV